MRRMPQRAAFMMQSILMNEAQKNAIRMGLAEWARYIDVEFVEVTESNTDGPVAFWGTTYSGASGYAWAIIPIGTTQQVGTHGSAPR